jgi:hypothetical protein
MFLDINPYLDVGNENLPSAISAFCDRLEYYKTQDDSIGV